MSRSPARRKRTKEHAEHRIGGLRGLSRRAVQFLRSHPGEARIAVTAALEAAAVQHEQPGELPPVGVSENLASFVVRKPWRTDTLGVSEAADRLRVSRTTVYDWVEKKTLLGWKVTKRGLTIPAEQILGPGKVAPGIRKVLEIIDDPELAWEFLAEEWPFAEGVVRPIEKLVAGEVEEVVSAAPSFGTAVT